MNKRQNPFHSLADAKRPGSSRSEHTPSTSPIDFAAGVSSCSATSRHTPQAQTRELARRRLVVHEQESVAAPLPPPTRAQRRPSRKLYSICFTWPSGRPWLGEKTNRNPPCWYAERVTEFIAARAADGTSSIQVALHGAIQAEVVAALERRWRAAFDEARRGSASARGGQQETLKIVRTAADAHPMLPIALRGVPLLDDASERTVLCVDVHDSLPRQAVEIDALIEQMEDEGRCAAFTTWAGYDLRSSFRRDDASIAPPRRLVVRRMPCHEHSSTQPAEDCAGLLRRLLTRCHPDHPRPKTWTPAGAHAARGRPRRRVAPRLRPARHPPRVPSAAASAERRWIVRRARRPLPR